MSSAESTTVGAATGDNAVARLIEHFGQDTPPRHRFRTVDVLEYLIFRPDQLPARLQLTLANRRARGYAHPRAMTRNQVAGWDSACMARFRASMASLDTPKPRREKAFWESTRDQKNAIERQRQILDAETFSTCTTGTPSVRTSIPGVASSANRRQSTSRVSGCVGSPPGVTGRAVGCRFRIYLSEPPGVFKIFHDTCPRNSGRRCPFPRS